MKGGVHVSKLFTFLENFDIDNLIKIYEDENLIFEGKTIGQAPVWYQI